ncbi:hypothetical protein ACFO3O_04515 [Dokdonia ponticola]|uniref:Gliding motility-associated protein GldM C-terminal domain-containing protein n=1 Tax=Dokdonia ponticola TaxID=2041041 RepID=A0ABV9HU93_9FLAO
MSKNTFNLSSVDMLACALGACIVLMLVFVVNIGGDEGSDGTSGGQGKLNGSSMSVLSNEILPGKMVFVRQVSIQCHSKQDYLQISNNLDVGLWEYDLNLRNSKHVQEQVYRVPEKTTVVYSLVSDTIVKSAILFKLNDKILNQDRTIASRGVNVNAKLLEGASIQDAEEVFSGFYELPVEVYGADQGFRNLSVTFKRRPAQDRARISKLIEIKNE